METCLSIHGQLLRESWISEDVTNYLKLSDTPTIISVVHLLKGPKMERVVKLRSKNGIMEK